MATNALKALKHKNVDVNIKAAAGQKKNNAGGYVFKIQDSARLQRFLTIGCEGGTYYVNETKLAQTSINFVEKFVKANALEALNAAINVSDKGLAKKNDFAIFVLAAVFTYGAPEVKAQARRNFNKIIRTTDHLGIFMTFLKENFNKGVGTSAKRAIADWYTSKPVDSLAYQVTKYRNRSGYTHRDLLRIGHPIGLDKTVGNFILGNEFDISVAPSAIQAFDRIHNASTLKAVIAGLNEFPKSPWEYVPTQFLTEPSVWRTIFENGGMGQTTLIRNVSKFNKLGLFSDMRLVKQYADALTNVDAINKGRVHPMTYFQAWAMQNNLNAKIEQAISDGYNLAFGNIVPAEKNTMIGVDVSGSMSWTASGMTGVNCREASGALAQILTAAEPYSQVNAFSTHFQELNIGPKDSLSTVVRKISGLSFGGTDCSVPMVHALANKIEVEHFVVITDNETWSGGHPFQALQNYRQSMGIDAKLSVVSLETTKFSTADPNRPDLMMDFSGFDASTPTAVSNFAAGRI